jgi:DNA-binding transcriptional ArsR family regulator
MRSEAPPLLPILRSRHLADVLTVLALHPGQEYTLTELANRAGIPLTTVQREAGRLASAGLLNERRVGRSRLVTVNQASRYFKPLTELVALAFGPRVAVAEEFGRLPVVAIGIYGSWATRYEGTPGSPPNDIDVLVIGDVPREDLYDAADRTERRVGLPVNPVMVGIGRWEAAADPLIQQIRSAPLLWVYGEPPTDGDA